MKCTLPADLPVDVSYVQSVEDHLDHTASEVDLEEERRRRGPQEFEDIEDTTEYVVDRHIDHDHDESGEPVFLIRWFACKKEEDAWEPWHALPDDKFQRYMKKNKIPLRK